jgi:DNA-binding PadR family transcriptional regulator
MLDWAGESQYYVEPKRLARLGYLEARKEPGKTRERTVYSLTDQGLAALRDYARTPARFTPLKSDPLLRLLIADLVGETVMRESLVARTSPTSAPVSTRASGVRSCFLIGASTSCS